MEKCILCESYDYKTIYEISNYKIVRCKKCKLVRRLENTFNNAISNLYEEDYFTKNVVKKGKDYISDWQTVYDQKRFIEEIKAIQKYKPSGTVLDIGTGIGNFLEIANNYGYKSTGIEISNFASEYAKTKGLDVINGKLEEINFEPESFDIITMHHFLEHVTNPYNILKLAFNILKKEGLFVIEVPNFASFRSKINGPLWEDLRPIEHIYQYEPKTLSLLLTKVGFQIINTRTKSEVLWSLAEPLKLLLIKDETIKKLQNTFFKNTKTNSDLDVIDIDNNIIKSKTKKYLLLTSQFLFYPLIKFYELLKIEKRLIIFAKK